MHYVNGRKFIFMSMLLEIKIDLEACFVHNGYIWNVLQGSIRKTLWL